MSFHHNTDQWLLQAQKEHCPYCLKQEDPTQSITLKLFKHSELCGHPFVPLRGTCYLMSRDHYVELFDMEEQALLGFMQEVQIASRALKQVTGAFRINYEIHGNTVPHLHLHLLPRYTDDPFAGKPIDFGQIEPPVYGPGGFEDFIRQMREKLKRL
jgi:diadenosine tetraphosphate (Ap4A) HIT family hydrolase